MANRTKKIRDWEILVEDFWNHVDIQGDNECWPWKKSVNHDGYGIYYYNNTQSLTHRFSWISLNGEIMDSNLRVLHKCDNPPCCNPSHLFLGTQAENIQDMINKGRMYKRNGERNSNAKLNENDVSKIKRLRRDGTTYKAIAKIMNVTESCVNHILNGRHWSWIK